MRIRVAERLDHILKAISNLEALAEGRSFDDLLTDIFFRAAFERFLEVISEASRHVPADLKARATPLPWRHIADLGNHLRHDYSRTDPDVIWGIYRNGRLTELREVIEILQLKLAQDEL